MVLSGDTIDGRRAHEIGLIDHVVNTNTFDADVSALVEKYSRVCSEGTRQSKMLLNLAFDCQSGSGAPVPRVARAVPPDDTASNPDPGSINLTVLFNDVNDLE
jgi:hypothetical protein